MLKEHIIKVHPEEEMPEELLGTENSLLAGGEGSLDADLEMDGDVENDDLTNQILDDTVETEEAIIEGEEITD